jgi:hypothetical protein
VVAHQRIKEVRPELLEVNPSPAVTTRVEPSSSSYFMPLSSTEIP